MSNLRSARLVGIGAIAGIALSLGLSALAERGNTGRNVLPLDELRQFSEVFGTIKAYYVEPVKDNKLITDAISGMLTGLDPHSACRSTPRASSAAWASRSAPRTASSRWSRPSRAPRRPRPASRPVT